MTTILRHDNTLQMAPRESFAPLLQDEAPYFSNLNRAPKNAYDYADGINKMLSYSGHVMLAKSAGPAFSINDLVYLTTDNTIALLEATVQDRYVRAGIVVMTMNADGYYTICLDSVNYLLLDKNLVPGTKFYANDFPTEIDPLTHPLHMSSTKQSGVTPGIDIGDYVIAVATSPTSIHFSGTVRNLENLP